MSPTFLQRLGALDTTTVSDHDKEFDAIAKAR
jgi:hypothetical protein